MNPAFRSSSHLSMTESLAEALPGSPTTDAVFAAWHRLMTKAGFRYWAYLAFDDQRRPIIRSSYPAVWLKRYSEENYLSLDPVVDEAKTSRVPYLWHEAAAKVRLNRRQQQFFDEAGEFGLTVGAGIPTWNPVGRQGLVSLVPDLRRGADFGLFYRQTKIDLLAAANLLHAQISRLRNPIDPASVHLTPRERDCLDLLLQGLPTSVIARRLGLTARGVQFHVENIKAKYGVKTRLQLLARFV